jgi:small subunit ribosomal protein S11
MSDTKEPTTTTEETPNTDAPVITEAAADTAATGTKPTPKAKKKKGKRSVPAGHVHVLASFNNTIVTITDTSGGVLTTASAGGCGFRGSKKGTAYAAQVAAEKAVANAKQQYGLNKADVFIKGVGLGREAAVRVLAASNVSVEQIQDVTGIAHGGCRPRKARRV